MKAPKPWQIALMTVGLVAGIAFSVGFWYAAYALHEVGLSLAPPPSNGVPPHTHPPEPQGLLPVLPLFLMIIPPIAGAGFGAWWGQSIAAQRAKDDPLRERHDETEGS